MRKILFGVIITLIILFTFKYCEDKKKDGIELIESTSLIQKQINNVGKLIVTEGHFSEVFTYKNSKDIFGEFLSFEKKALIVANAKVTVAYDLSKIEYNIDEVSKTLTITQVPEKEININPDIEYYDIQADYLNPFEAEDHNQIKKIIKASITKKLEASQLKSNAENRLISELSKFYILTNSLGWTLKYKEEQVGSIQTFENLKL